jgi:tetratricopeptide (TPR) repeat protein
MVVKKYFRQRYEIQRDIMSVRSYLTRERNPHQSAMPNLKFFLYILLFTLFTANVSVAQTNGDYQIAQALMQGGDYAKALPIFEKLYAREPSVFAYYDGLKTCYTQTQAYDKLISLYDNELARKPDDVPLLLQKAQTYYTKGDNQSADRIMDGLAADIRTPNRYITVILTPLEQAKRFDRVIKFGRLGREKFSGEFLFASQLANAYLFLGKYAEATDEYLNLMDMPNFDLAFVQSRIQSYATRSDEFALRAAIGVIRKKQFTDFRDQMLLILLGNLLIEARDFDAAYTTYKKLDELTTSNGTQLLSFAETALQNKAFEQAEKAFKEIQDSPNQMVSESASFGLAKTAAARAADEPSVRSLQDAVAKHEAFQKEHANSLLAPKALLRAGLLLVRQPVAMTQGSTPNADARKIFERLVSLYPNATETQTAKLQLSKLSLSEGNLNKAEYEVLNVLKSKTLSESTEEARFLLGKINYYQLRFADAVKILPQINLAANASNDALELRLLLLEGMADTTDTLAMRSFRKLARVDFQMEQKKYLDAIDALDDLLKENPDSKLADDVAFRKAVCEQKTRQFDKAVTSYEAVVTQFPKSYYADKSLYFIGTLYEIDLKDKSKAAATYERLLIQFPLSIYAAEVRERLRNLKDPKS